MKYGQAPSVQRRVRRRAHSRCLKTFLRSDRGCAMFAAPSSHQCSPMSPKSSALAKPFNPAHGPPFRWLYSSSSTAKFQSCAAMPSEHSRVPLYPAVLLRQQETPCCCFNTVRTQGREGKEQYRKDEEKHDRHPFSPIAALMMSASPIGQWQPRPLKLLVCSMSVSIECKAVTSQLQYPHHAIIS